MDILVLLVMGLGTFIGYKRGLVHEVTDCLIGVIGGFIAFRGFRPFGGFVLRMAPGWGEDASMRFGFWFLFLVFGIAILTAGLHIDRATREFDRIPPEVRNYGGGLIAFFKCLVISILLAVYLPTADGISPSERAIIKRSAASTGLRVLSAPVGALMGVLCPADIAKRFNELAK